MKAEIKDGNLIIIPQNNTENYALVVWFEQNVNGCTGNTTKGNVSYESYRRYKASIKGRLKRWYYLRFLPMLNK